MSSIRGYHTEADLGACQNFEKQPPKFFQEKSVL